MLKGSLVLGLEDTGSRMSRLGKGELLYGELLTVDEVLRRVDAVTPDDVRAVAADLLRRPQSLAVVGPFDESRLRRGARLTTRFRPVGELGVDARAAGGLADCTRVPA